MSDKRHVLCSTILEHKDIQHMVRYTELSPDRFKSFWRIGHPSEEARKEEAS